jgi:hypothetical protein
MRSRDLIKSILFLILVSCGKGSGDDTVIPPEPESKCAKGKLIAKSNCREYIVQVIQGNIGQEKVTASWFDLESGVTYNNVFTVYNYCEITDTLPTGKEFYFNVLDSHGPQSCNTCPRNRPAPDKGNAIEIKFIPCQ